MSRGRPTSTLPGAATDVATRWSGRFGDRALILTREQAIDEGWFRAGRGAQCGADRGRGRSLRSGARRRDSRSNPSCSLLGMHGSLTSAETSVPLLHHAALPG